MGPHCVSRRLPTLPLENSGAIPRSTTTNFNIFLSRELWCSSSLHNREFQHLPASFLSPTSVPKRLVSSNLSSRRPIRHGLHGCLGVCNGRIGRLLRLCIERSQKCPGRIRRITGPVERCMARSQQLPGNFTGTHRPRRTSIGRCIGESQQLPRNITGTHEP